VTATEIAVVVLGALLGYWVVSLFLRKKPTPPMESEEARASSSPVPWHQVLGVPESSPPEEIRRAYKSLMGQYHPDKVDSLGAEFRELAERKSKEIGAAYQEAMQSRGLES
jgi:preprotein translocase subunit Sec63